MVAAALRTAQIVQVVQVDSSPGAVLLAAAWAWRQSWSLCPDDIYEGVLSVTASGNARLARTIDLG